MNRKLMRVDLSGLQNRWLAVQVRCGWEFSTSSCLKEGGYETFCPTYLKRREWSDRIKVLTTPLFPGYLFVRFRNVQQQPIVSAPGVIRLLCVGNRPLPVEDFEIQSLQAMNRAGFTCGPCAFMKIGQEVEIAEGALQGLRGHIVQIKGKHRLIISVELLRKSVFVEIDGYKIAAVSPLQQLVEGEDDSRLRVA
jgi:transcription antitermination factor NusG